MTDASGKLVAEQSCRGRGPCANYDKTQSTKSCFVGYIELATYLGLSRPGNYWVEWVGENGSDKIGPMSFTLREPVGVDKEVYEKLLLPAWEHTLAKADWEGWLAGVYVKGKPSSYSTILDKYPTSTYAGYVLARKIPDYSNPLFHPVPPAKQLMMAREEGKTYVAFPDKSFEQYFQQLDRFMKGGHIPESLRTVLWSFYGDQLVRRGRFTEAEEAFQRATQGTPPTGGKALAYYERAKGFLEAFEAKKQPAQEP